MENKELSYPVIFIVALLIAGLSAISVYFLYHIIIMIAN